MGIVEPLLADIHRAGERITDCFLRDGKLMTCGCSSAAAISQYMTTLLLTGVKYDRPGLPALALTATAATLSDTNGQREIYARQVRALGHAGDVLLLLSANTNSAALVQTIVAAHDRNIAVVAVTGADDQDISAALAAEEDIELYVATSSRTRAIEAQVLIAHCCCALIEQALFGIGESG